LLVNILQKSRFFKKKFRPGGTNFFRSIYCVIKCVKTKRVLKRKFASPVLNVLRCFSFPLPCILFFLGLSVALVFWQRFPLSSMFKIFSVDKEFLSLNKTQYQHEESVLTLVCWQGLWTSLSVVNPKAY
jgi:hypothetical protein